MANLGPLNITIYASVGAEIQLAANDFEPEYDPQYNGAIVSTDFGIDANGPYYNLGGSLPSEKALLVYDNTGAWTIVKATSP